MENQYVIHSNFGLGVLKELNVFDDKSIVSFSNENGEIVELQASNSMLKVLGKEDVIINRLENVYNLIITDDMRLIEISDLMDEVGFSYYYVSYRYLDIIECANDEGFDDVEIYLIRDGFMGFLKGMI